MTSSPTSPRWMADSEEEEMERSEDARPGDDGQRSVTTGHLSD